MKKIYCKDCKFRIEYWPEESEGWSYYCFHENNAMLKPSGEEYVIKNKDLNDINKNYNCRNYNEKNKWWKWW